MAKAQPFLTLEIDISKGDLADKLADALVDYLEADAEALKKVGFTKKTLIEKLVTDPSLIKNLKINMLEFLEEYVSDALFDSLYGILDRNSLIEKCNKTQLEIDKKREKDEEEGKLNAEAERMVKALVKMGYKISK